MYLFVAYKPDSENSGHGWHDASYISDFYKENNIETKENLVKIFSEYLYKNMILGPAEEGYEISIFKDGICIFDNNRVCWDGYCRYKDEERELELEHRNSAYIEANSLFKEANELATNKRNFEIEILKKENLKRKNKLKLEEEKYKRVLFEKLKKELGE